MFSERHLGPRKQEMEEMLDTLGVNSLKELISLAIPASIIKDMSDGNRYDLLIAAIAALSLIFVIMLLITRAVIASAASSRL